MKQNPRTRQLNIRLTQAQHDQITKKAKEAQKTKTQLILDLLNTTPTYILPDLPQTIQQIKYLGNKANELSLKLDEKNSNTEETKKLVSQLQQGCDELWQLLKSLRQAAPKQL